MTSQALVKALQLGFKVCVTLADGLLSVAGGVLEASHPDDHRTPSPGRVRTAAGAVEPVAYDDNGQRVGAKSGAPAIGDG